MSVAWIGAAVGVAGIASSAIGSANAASSANKATDKANLDSHIKELNRLVRLEGPQKGLATWKAGTDRNTVRQVLGMAAEVAHANPEQMQQIVNLNQQISDLKARGGGTNAMGRPGANKANSAAVAALESQRDALVKQTGAHPAVQGLLNEDQINAMGPGLADEYTGLAEKAGQQGQSNLAGYDASTAALERQSRDIEAGAARFGQQREATIRKDAGRSLTNANAASTAALMGRGLGASSALTDAYGGNAEGNQRGLDSALGALGDSQIQLKTGLQTGRLGLASSRASGRSAMQLGGQADQRQLQLGALNVKQSALSSDQPYYPGGGYSPSAAALGTAGTGLSGAGSALAGYGFQSYLANLNKPKATQYGNAPYAQQSFNQYGEEMSMQPGYG